VTLFACLVQSKKKKRIFFNTSVSTTGLFCWWFSDTFISVLSLSKLYNFQEKKEKLLKPKRKIFFLSVSLFL